MAYMAYRPTGHEDLDWAGQLQLIDNMGLIVSRLCHIAWLKIIFMKKSMNGK